MPIKANNIVVGGVKPPTEEKKNKNSIHEKLKTLSFQDVRAQAVEEVKKEKQKVTKPVEVTEEKPRYLEKEDGELVRHINTKSHYLRDMFEI